MAEPRYVPRSISAGVILVDPHGRVLMQLRDDDPRIMYPGHWGLTGGAADKDEPPEDTARREVREETGIDLEHFEPFRAYYFAGAPAAKPSSRARAEYELYIYHAACTTPLEDMICGEGRELRFLAPEEIGALDIAYNHREVLAEFFASPAYRLYVSGVPFEDGGGSHIDPRDRFLADLDAGAPWFEALMSAIATWERAEERAGDREYRYLVGGEAFDWLLLAERLAGDPAARVDRSEVERLLFHGIAPDGDGRPIEDARLRELIGEAKHRAHLNYVYGVTVEEALQYAVELEVAKERSAVSIRDPRADPELADPVFERIYGKARVSLLGEFREERGLAHAAAVTLGELREFTYWLFKYRVKHSEPARVASDTRKALAQLSAIEDAVRRARARADADRAPAAVPQ